MMYWTVFALCTLIETFTDVSLTWFPFYHEIKIVLVTWLLSPVTKGLKLLLIALIIDQFLVQNVLVSKGESLKEFTRF